jgi:hypothetical protein
MQDFEERRDYVLEALILSVLLIYMILASQFGSFVHQLSIMGSGGWCLKPPSSDRRYCAYTASQSPRSPPMRNTRCSKMLRAAQVGWG